jgi:flagellar biosynthetic protein FliP
VTFVRHYLEMVAAMLIGMVVLGVPAEASLHAMGTSASQLQDDAPAVLLLGMAFVMTVPMVAWMRHRGHATRPSAEMAASMFVPTFGVIGVMASGAVTDFMTLMTAEHLVMLPSMLVAMLLRPDEYTGGVREVVA